VSRPQPFNISAQGLQAACPHLEPLCRVAYEGGRDAATPCGLFVPSFFPKGRPRQGRPSDAHRVTLPGGWILSEWALGPVLERQLATPAAWARSEEPVPKQCDRRSDLGWLLQGRRKLIDRGFATVAADAQASFEELEALLHRSLGVPASVLRIWLDGLGWGGLRSSELATLWVTLVKYTQLAYVAARGARQDHAPAWERTLDRLTGLYAFTTRKEARRGRWLKRRVATALMNGRKANSLAAINDCDEVAQRLGAHDGSWPWRAPGGQALAGHGLAGTFAIVCALLQVLVDEGRAALPGLTRSPAFSDWEPRYVVQTLEQMSRAVILSGEVPDAASARGFGEQLSAAADLVAATRNPGPAAPRQVARLTRWLAAGSGADAAELGAYFNVSVLPSARQALPAFCVGLEGKLSVLHEVFRRRRRR